jgi:heterotetrameric sarcosine oxidase delta subunit
MLSITCPWCGPRDEVEFTYGGEAQVSYPPDSESLDDSAWSDYLFYRRNPAGPWCERWVHSSGCRRWFEITRDTVTHEIAASDPSRGEAGTGAVEHG